MTRLRNIDPNCPRCGKLHWVYGEPGCGVEILNGPDRPGTTAELYADRELPDMLVRLMTDSPWWSIGCIDSGERQGVSWHGKLSIVTVTESWNDRQVVRSCQPAYEEHHMWGMRCDSANITVTIPISP